MFAKHGRLADYWHSCRPTYIYKFRGKMRHTLLMKQLSLQYCLSAIKGVRKRGGWGYPPLSLIFYKNFIIWEVRRAWFFTKIRRVRVEEYAYYVNKLRLKTWIWLQIVTSQRAHTKCKWPPYATEWTPPWKFSAYATECNHLQWG